jgi:hypothetical protein
MYYNGSTSNRSVALVVQMNEVHSVLLKAKFLIELPEGLGARAKQGRARQDR